MAQAAAGALGPASPGVDAVHHASENGIERGHLKQACKENDCCVANKDEQQRKPSSKLSCEGEEMDFYSVKYSDHW